MTGSSLTLGTAGSRRTVYLIDENPKLPDTAHSNAVDSVPTSATATTTTSPAQANNGEQQPPQPPSTVLMYNRISNVIGGSIDAGSSSGTTTVDTQPPADKDKRNTDESAVWYEYGCV